MCTSKCARSQWMPTVVIATHLALLVVLMHCIHQSLPRISGVLRRTLCSAAPCTRAPSVTCSQPRAVSEVPTPLRRFWVKETTLQASDKVSAIRSIEDMLERCTEGPAGEQSNAAPGDLGRAEHGLVIVPGLNLILPVQNGVVQSQHAAMIDLVQKENAEDAAAGRLRTVMCGFFSRAQSSLQCPERPLDNTRKEALDKAMKELGMDVTGDDLLGGQYVGTSVSKMYRSFVCPRPAKGAQHFPESIDRQSYRVADQINFEERRMRADRASYLRNVDSAVASESNNNINSPLTSSSADNEATLPNGPRSRVSHPVVLVLDSVRSAENVGSIFRSAETAGATEIVTCGFTPHPPHPKISKTALQSADLVPTRHFLNPLDAIRQLKEEGYTIAVMETTSLSKCYTDVRYPQKTAFVMGNEMLGVDTRIVEMADLVVEIPTYGVKNSLNVGCAASVVLFEVLRQWHASA
jgi:23S rRNA (guanosine2251-2'-O)-methyltransferase